MSGKQAIRALEAAGYSKRMGKGDHVVMRKGERVIIISGGKSQLSSGMTAKVRSHLGQATREMR